MTILSKQVAFGVRPEWATAPIVNVPEGAEVVRRRFRFRDVGVAFVRCRGVISRHHLALAPGGLELLWPNAVNRKERCAGA